MLDLIVLSILFFICIGTGIMAGLFFSFSAFIMEALRKVDSRYGMETMKSINRAILNPLFGLVFFGTTIMAMILLTTVSLIPEWNGKVYVICGSVLYLVGVLVVTFRFNIPLNNRLEKTSSIGNGFGQSWEGYMKSWSKWNHVRTITALAALMCFVLGFKYF